MTWLGVAVAGAIGAPCRYVVDLVVKRLLGDTFPWSTLVVNASGSLLLGLIVGAAMYHGFPTTPKIWLGTGFCGAYTTFSGFTLDTLTLLEDGDNAAALRNVALSTTVCLAAAAVGLAIAAI